jgi:hypothetical protein
MFHHVGQRREHVRLPLVGHGAVLGPAGGDVGNGQSETELPARIAALVPDQVWQLAPGPGAPTR